MGQLATSQFIILNNKNIHIVYVPWPCIPRKLTNDKAKRRSRRRASVLILLVDVCIKYVRMRVSALFSAYVSVLEFLLSKLCLQVCTAHIPPYRLMIKCTEQCICSLEILISLDKTIVSDFSTEKACMQAE